MQPGERRHGKAVRPAVWPYQMRTSRSRSGSAIHFRRFRFLHSLMDIPKRVRKRKSSAQ